jgi:hypothetical protein
MQQPCSSSFGYRSDTCLAPFSAVRTVLFETSSFGNNFCLICTHKRRNSEQRNNNFVTKPSTYTALNTCTYLFS